MNTHNLKAEYKEMDFSSLKREKKTFTFRIYEEIVIKFKTACAKNELSPSDVLSELMKKYSEKKKAK